MSSSLTQCDHAKYVPELGDCQGFLIAFVNSKLPTRLRRYIGASDVVQSVLFTASRQGERFRGTTEGEFQAWLIQIARYKIIDGIRKYRSRQVDVPDHSFPSCIFATKQGAIETPSVHVALDEQASELLRALETLPSDVRQIVSYRYAEGMTFEEIGIQMKLPASTARRRWLEGCQLLKERLSHTLQ